MKTSTRNFSLIMITALSGCNDTTGKSDTVTTNFSLTGSGQNAVAQNSLQKAFSVLFPSAMALIPPMLVDSNMASVQLNEAWIVVKKIQFKSSELEESGEADNTNYRHKGPFYVDLLSNDPISFGDFKMSKSGIRRVKMLLHKGNDLPASAPVELADKSIYLSGSVNGHNFSYAADDTTVFSISGPNALVPEEQKDFLAVIRFGDLIKKIDLSSITGDRDITSSSRGPATNPCPTIHAGASDLYTCFIKGMALEAKFGKDSGDKDLTSDDETVE